MAYTYEEPLPVANVGSPVLDSAGTPINPDNMSHTYGYTSGNLVTDTATDGTSTWVKTFGYTDGNVTSESLWVKQ